MQDLPLIRAFHHNVFPVLDNYINNAKQSLFSEGKWLE